MKKNTYLAIPIAALLLMGTTVSAFNEDLLQKVGLTDSQISAFEEAKELRKSGDKEGARDILVEAGIDLSVIEKIREAAHSEHKERHDALRQAVQSGDYEAFSNLSEVSPLADKIDSEADFLKLKQAHELREAGDKEGAKSIYDELGIKPGHGHGKKGSHRGHFQPRCEVEDRQ